MLDPSGNRKQEFCIYYRKSNYRYDFSSNYIQTSNCSCFVSENKSKKNELLASARWQISNSVGDRTSNRIVPFACLNCFANSPGCTRCSAGKMFSERT